MAIITVTAQANERLAKRAEKAQKLLDTELLKDSYIETLSIRKVVLIHQLQSVQNH